MPSGLVIRLLIVTLFLQAGPAVAQQLIFFKPENLKQLPSSETYNVMQDPNGFIWFSTEGGLCRYNGDNLKVFDARAGLPEAATYAVKIHDNQVWVSTSKSRVLRYTRRGFVELPFTQKVSEQFYKRKYAISQMAFVNDTSMMVSSQRNNNVFVDLKTNTVREQDMSGPGDFFFRVYPNAEFTVRVPWNQDSVLAGLKRKWFRVAVEINNQTYMYKFPYEQAYFPSWRCYVQKDKKNKTWIGIDNTIIEIDPNGSSKLHHMQNTMLSMFIDKQDGLWVGLLNNGLHYFPDSRISDEVTSLPDLSVSGVCEDNEGGIWCTTLEKGIFYCRNRSIIDYSNSEEYKKPVLLKYIDGHLFTSGRKNVLVEMCHKKVTHHLLNVANIPFADIVRNKNGWLLCSNNYLGVIDGNYSMPHQILRENKIVASSKQLTNMVDGHIYGLTYGAVYGISPPNIFLHKKTPLPANCILLSRQGVLYIGGSDGLHTLKDTSWVKVPGVTGHVSRMIQLSNDQIWITTKDEGVYLLDKDRVENFDKYLKLKTKRFSDLAEDKFGNIWLASNIGLVKVRPFKNEFESFYYNTLSGLPSNEIYKVAPGDSVLYFTTPEGLCSFPLPEKLSNPTPPVLLLEELYVNGGRVTYENAGLNLPHNKNTVKIRMNVFTFKRASVVPTIIYIVKGAGLNYQSVRSNELVLNNLSPGKYTVTIYAVNNDLRLSTHPLTMNFTIEKPWWQSLFFVIPVLLFFLLLVFIVTRMIIRRIRNREKEKTRINKLLAEYHMSALRAQMNPHFIFNCINSIQRFILTKKSQEAYNYLTKFSRLIRLVLNYAEKNLITLSQELEIVELYTELEQLRFDNKFTYQFRIAGNIKPDEMFVPVLIIQPYIENAIWHGIMNLDKEKAGHISITVLYENNILKIVVEDNGVGRVRAAAFSKKDHESKATWINNKRAEIINMAGNNVQTVRIEDILSIDGSVAGTRVSIYINQTNHKPYEQDQLRYS